MSLPTNRKHRLCRMSPPTKRMNTTQQTTSIEGLPWEMISELFEYLHPKDLAACSMVNRRWHSVYAAFKTHSLAVTGYRVDYEFSRWFNSNRPIREADRCSLAMFRRLAKKPLLSSLKQLTLHDYDPEFDLKHLNRFSRLVHLEIYMVDFDEVNWKINLNLPQLKVLAIHYFNNRCSVSVDCPQLSTLAYDDDPEDAAPLKVKHPETIKMLHTSLVGPKLAPFKSVECLVIDKFELISKATLQSLPRLRELRYDGRIQDLIGGWSDGQLITIDRMKRTLIEFLDEAKKLRGSDFQFTFSGFQLTTMKLDQIDFGLGFSGEDEGGPEWVCNEYVYLKNYHLIEPGAMQFINHVNYTRLLSHVTGEFPRCFAQKFSGIEWVHVDRVVKDPDHLLWFLKSLRFLRRLELETIGLSQEFFDQLPASARSLTRLHLQGGWKNELQLNFDFIPEFSRFSSLVIHQLLSLQSFTSLVRSSANLVDSRFNVWLREERGSTVWNVTDFRRSCKADNSDKAVSLFAKYRAARQETGKASD